MTDIQILKRLYHDYTKKHLKKIIIALLLSVAVAGSTSSIAYLLDPAIKQIFMNKDQTLIIVIPILIVVAFAVKGLSLYVAKVIMIGVSEEVRKDVQVNMLNNLIDAEFHHSFSYKVSSSEIDLETENNEVSEVNLISIKNLKDIIRNNTPGYLVFNDMKEYYINMISIIEKEITEN